MPARSSGTSRIRPGFLKRLCWGLMPPDSRCFIRSFTYLFNSYYNAVGDRLPRPRRGLITRPTLDEVYRYRAAMDRAMEGYLDSAGEDLPAAVAAVIELGLNHEQQHQELILTDIKHALAQNPLRPAYRERVAKPSHGKVRPMAWSFVEGGIKWIGHEVRGSPLTTKIPRHRVFLRPFELASRLVTNGEYPGLHERWWLRAARTLALRRLERRQGPAMGSTRSTGRKSRVSGGHTRWAASVALSEPEPVCHVSYYEADAFARWAGVRLPTEAEWESAARDTAARRQFPRMRPSTILKSAIDGAGIAQCFGDVWEWTAEPVHPLPWLAADSGCPRRVQRQVHVQPACPPRRFVRDPGLAHSCDLPKLFSPRGSLAIHGHPTGERHMISSSTTISRHDETISWRRQFLQDVLRGLSRPQKEISCKYFYDERGSALFDEICELDEYYLTRTELAILDAHAAEMAEAIGEDCELIEFGSGSGLKTRLLLEQLQSPRGLSAGRHRARTARAVGTRAGRPFPGPPDPAGPRRLYRSHCCCPRPANPGHGVLCTFRARPSATSARRGHQPSVHDRLARGRWRRTARRLRPRQGRVDRLARLQRSPGRQRGLQPQPAREDQPRARGQLQCDRVFAPGRLRSFKGTDGDVSRQP